jgi:Protein of unknown function, DUF547
MMHHAAALSIAAAAVLALGAASMAPARAGTAPAPPLSPNGRAAPPPPASPPPRPRPPTTIYTLESANGAMKFLLKNIVSADGLVHYDKLARGMLSGLLESTVDAYAAVKLPDDNHGKLSMWINAYNANVLTMAGKESRQPGFVSVDKVVGFFDQRPITVAGETMTLDQLEKQKIASMGDPRFHAALVCAAMSCPPLRAEPYFPDRLEAQLEEQSHAWVNDPSRNGVEGDALSLSMIFDWSKADFVGKPYGDVIGFVRQYAAADGPIAALLARNPAPEVKFKPYDWSLNRAAAAPRDIAPQSPAGNGTSPALPAPGNSTPGATP